MEEIIDIHFNGQLYLYLSNSIRKQDYDIYYSELIDDEYWNLAYLKNNEVSLKETFEKIKIDMSKLNRRPIVYITSNINNSNLQEEIDNSNLNLLYTDVWMILDNLKKFESYKSKVDFSVYKVDKTLKNKFIQAVMDGFSGDNPEDPYESLSDGYKISLEKSFNENNSEYKNIHYLGMKGQEAISTATVVYRKSEGTGKAIIYNVTTNKKYQRNGVCKQMMSDIIKDLIKLNIDEVCVQTEEGFYTEQVYKKMGFKEKILGKAYAENE